MGSFKHLLHPTLQQVYTVLNKYAPAYISSGSNDPFHILHQNQMTATNEEIKQMYALNIL